MRPLLAPDEPPAFAIEHAGARSDFVLSCDHAGRRIPRALGDLGLPVAERERHIGWDIGAAGLATVLSRRLDATLIAQPYSRLVIDCNRPLDSAQLVPRQSERTVIPGNLDIDAEARALRIAAIHAPYHAAITQLLDARERTARKTVFVAVHTFTPVYLDDQRPWQIAVLSGSDRSYAENVLSALRTGTDYCIGDNEPYRIDHEDFGIPVHGIGRGLPNVLLEIRQDLVAEPEQQIALAEPIAHALETAWSRFLDDAV